MKCVFLITGKPFAFSTLKVAQKFREEYAPLNESKLGAKMHLSIPESIYKIVPTFDKVDRVYDKIEDCLQDFPQEVVAKYDNECKKIKSSISLKTPLVFDNHLKAHERMVLKTSKVSYDILKTIATKGRENLKNINIDNPNAIVTSIQLNGRGKFTPIAAVTVKQFREIEKALAQTEEKLEALKQEYNMTVVRQDDENQME